MSIYIDSLTDTGQLTFDMFHFWQIRGTVGHLKIANLKPCSKSKVASNFSAPFQMTNLEFQEKRQILWKMSS